MKAFTDISQSKKLAEILPLESADMSLYKEIEMFPFELHSLPYSKHFVRNDGGDKLLPCWSLAALLDVLPYPQLSKDKLGSGKEGWMVSVYPDNCRYDSCWHDNTVDACVEMILKLHELNLL